MLNVERNIKKEIN